MSTTSSGMLQGRDVLLAVCGGISAYKSADLCSKLVQAGASVTVCMTPEAVKFVQPLTFQALSGKPVRTDIFELPDSSDPQHISLTEQASLLVVAPATAHMLAKIACGLCDDIVSLLVCAAACPVLFAPAMNNRMWANPITQQNVSRLRDLGYSFVGPEEGWLACRSTGPGRMSDPATILQAVQQYVIARDAPTGKIIA